jgi:DNA polymerase III subunit delta
LANHLDIVRELKSNNPAPVYILSGQEPYYIDVIAEAAENILDESQKGFDQTILYGDNCSVSTIIETAKRYPLLSPKQVVIVKEAQNLDKLDGLQAYTENPLDSTILVVCVKLKEGKTKALPKKSKTSKAVFFNSAKEYDNKVTDWIVNHAKELGIKIDLKACNLLFEFIGNDLSRIHNELKKLTVNVPPDKVIDSMTIEKFVGISKDYNIFELQNAFTNRDVLKANRIINYYANSKSFSLPYLISILYNYFEKLITYHELARNKVSPKEIETILKLNFFTAKDMHQSAKIYNYRKSVDCLNILMEYDLKSKGYNNSSATVGDLLKEMVFKIMH